MAKPIFPPIGSRLRRFLDAMLTQTMAQHPEFVQRTGHTTLLAMAKTLRGQHWPVEQVDLVGPDGQQVTLYHIGAYARDAAIGEATDD